MGSGFLKQQKTIRIIHTVLILPSLFVLILAFQNCSNKGQLDLDSLGKLAVHTVQPPIMLDAVSGLEQMGYSTTTNDDERGVVFQAAGNLGIVSSVKIKIDLQKEYRISGRFKSVGSTTSNVYFGVATYRANGQHIESWEGTRTGFPAIIGTVSDTAITTTNDIIGWHTGDVSAYYKAIGFYFDGNTNRLPDYVHTNWGDGSADIHFGAYGTASGKTIELNLPLPEDILARITPQTRIYNHYAGGTYVYTVNSNTPIPSTWTEYSATITGFDMANSSNRFRPETDHVSLIILANYQQDASAVLLFDDLRFEEVR